jgi:hypothetical protein
VQQHPSPFVISYLYLYIVKYVPEWVPGAGFKRQAKEWRKLQEAVRNRPFKMVQEQRVRFRLLTSLQARLLLTFTSCTGEGYIKAFIREHVLGREDG